MLNTVMALWNQNPGESRQRIVKVLVTFLFTGISISLLLFTINSSARFSVTGTEPPQPGKEESVHSRNHSGIAPAGNTPASSLIVVGITPTATLSSTHTVVQSCAPTPSVVVPQQATATPQKTVIYYGNSGLKNEGSTQRHGNSNVMHPAKSKLRPGKKGDVNVVVTPVPHARETVNITLPALPAPATMQPPVTPIITASPTATFVSTGEVVVNSVPDSVVVGATPNGSANPFGQSLKRNDAMHVPVSPLARANKKGSNKQNEPMQMLSC